MNFSQLIDEIRKSDACVINMFSVDPICQGMVAQIGAMILLNKPIIAVVKPGTQIPRKLSLVIDRFVELDEANIPQVVAAVREAVHDLGVVK